VGATCDDGDACTVDDTCNANGLCESTPLDCAAQAGSCAVGTCDPLTGCTFTPVADGTGCNDDGNLCTAGSCSAGACVETALACQAGDQCNAAACDPATGCSTTPRTDALCDDGDPCTAGDSCSSAGVCSGTTLECSALDSACSFGVCDGANSTCMAMAVNEGQSCDGDPDNCTEETCSAGTCAVTTTLAECSACGSTNFCHGDLCESNLSSVSFDFESMYPPQEFVSSTWSLTSSDSFDGTRSLKSGTPAAGQVSSVTLDVFIDRNGSVGFVQKTLLDADAEMIFYVDGVEQSRQAGNSAWIPGVMSTRGRHQLRWDVIAGASGLGPDQGGFLDKVVVRNAVEEVIDFDVDLGPLTTSGSAPFAVNSVGAYEGAGSAFAGASTQQTSYLSHTFTVTRDSTMTFYAVNEKPSGDTFELWIDGVKSNLSFWDYPGWYPYKVDVTPGTHTVEWRLIAGTGTGLRTIGVDDIVVNRANCL
jgi:hypothetical protein